MALISTVYPPEIWANESLMVLSNELVMGSLVHRDFENEVRRAGDKVHTRKPANLSVSTLNEQSGTNAAANVTVQNPNATDLSITLNTHKYVAYLISDRDQAEALHDLREEFLRPAVVPLASKVDADVLTAIHTNQDWNSTQVTAVANATVGANSACTSDDIIAGKKAMDDNKCPLENRRLILSSDHNADLLSENLFQQANMAGSTQGLRNAVVGRAFGFDTYMSQQVPTATDTQSTPQSFGFHRNGVTLCVRPLGSIGAGTGAVSAETVHEGLSIRIVTSYESLYSGTVVKFEILYGAQLLDASLATIINP